MAKILVVDDEQLTVEMLSTFLKLIGHQAIGALSARQTWDKLAYEEPDLCCWISCCQMTTASQSAASYA